MSTAGIFNTSNFAPEQLTKSFANVIMTKFPGGQATLFGLTSRLKSTTAKQPQHTYYQEYMIFPSLKFTQAFPAAAPGNVTTINVVNTDGIVPNQIFKVSSTDEDVMVVNVPGTTSVTIQRGVGLAPPTAALLGAEAYMTGNAFEESSLRPLAIALNPSPVTNLTQIVRNSWAVSGTTEASMQDVGEPQIAKSRKDAALFHAIDIEKAILFGERYEGVRNGQPFRRTDGLISVMKQYAPQNISIAGAQTTYDQLEAMLDSGFDITSDPGGPNDRLLLLGSQARKVLNTLGRYQGDYQIVDGQTSFGLQFSQFKIARGQFIMLEHPLFNTNPVWQKLAISVDLSSLSLAYLKGRKTQYRGFNSSLNGDAAETQDGGLDALGGTFTTELATEFRMPETNSVIWNLTSAACNPCVPVDNAENGCLTVDYPCSNGAVAPATSVTVTITLPATTTITEVSLATPDGLEVVPITGGVGTYTYTTGTNAQYVFSVISTEDTVNVTWSPSYAIVCVTQPCDPGPGTNDLTCATVVNPA